MPDMRQFSDLNGRSWEVFEVGNETLAVGRVEMLPSALRTGWLVFDNGQERRRLAPFPGEWAAFSHSGLCALLAAAQPVTAKRVPRALDLQTRESTTRGTA